LDDELFKHAHHLMTQQRQRLEAAGKLQLLPPRAQAKPRQRSATQQGSKLPGALKAPAGGSSGSAVPELASTVELDSGAGRPLSDADKRKIQGHIMQQLQQALSSKGTSEWVWLGHALVVSRERPPVTMWQL
jgi:hypothetical protein